MYMTQEGLTDHNCTVNVFTNQKSDVNDLGSVSWPKLNRVFTNQNSDVTDPGKG